MVYGTNLTPPFFFFFSFFFYDPFSFSFFISLIFLRQSRCSEAQADVILKEFVAIKLRSP
jgi:hypothetical protein